MEEELTKSDIGGLRRVFRQLGTLKHTFEDHIEAIEKAQEVIKQEVASLRWAFQENEAFSQTDAAERESIDKMKPAGHAPTMGTEKSQVQEDAPGTAAKESQGKSSAEQSVEERKKAKANLIEGLFQTADKISARHKERIKIWK